MEISVQMILLLVAVGLAAGLMSGFVGIGGGVIMVPVLYYGLGFSQMSAQGTSLAVLAMPVGILAVMNYYKAGEVSIPAALLIACGFVVGGYFGSKYALKLPEHKVKFIFALIMIIVMVRMLYSSGMKWFGSES